MLSCVVKRKRKAGPPVQSRTEGRGIPGRVGGRSRENSDADRVESGERNYKKNKGLNTEGTERTAEFRRDTFDRRCGLVCESLCSLRSLCRSLCFFPLVVVRRFQVAVTRDVCYNCVCNTMS